MQILHECDLYVCPFNLVCGKPTRMISDYERILGGREAPENAIPWQVLLNIEGTRVGGMVIAERWIMTAAHELKHRRKVTSSETVQVSDPVRIFTLCVCVCVDALTQTLVSAGSHGSH